MKDNVVVMLMQPHSDDDYVHAAHLMKSAGSFASHLADAYFAADKYNRARLRAAFPELFVQFYNLWLRLQQEKEV